MKKQHFNISEDEWNQQFSTGKWDYLGKVPVERARSAVIIGVFGHGKLKVLDVGCGEGLLTDFLFPDQQKGYLGIDISKAAISIAKNKRNRYSFKQTRAELFEPSNDQGPFDLIVFNEVLYYFDHIQLMKKYSTSRLLAPDGVIIISVWYMSNMNHLKSTIFSDARNLFDVIDAIDISGMSGAGRKKMEVSFHIEGFRVKR